MKNIYLWLFLSFIAITPMSTQAQERGGAINEKVDLLTPRLKPGITFWFQNQAYYGAELVDVSLDGSLVKITTTRGTLEPQWNQIAPEARAKFYKQYIGILDEKRTILLEDAFVIVKFDELISATTGKQVFIIKDYPNLDLIRDGGKLPKMVVKLMPNKDGSFPTEGETYFVKYINE